MKDEKELWNNFMISGRIDDYLKYRQTVNDSEEPNAVEHTGLSDPGADAPGERQSDLDPD